MRRPLRYGQRRTRRRRNTGTSLSHTPAHAPAHKGALRPDPGLEPAHAQIMRDFMHPKLELTRLLHEAAEIEHALMAQYLYAASR